MGAAAAMGAGQVLQTGGDIYNAYQTNKANKKYMQQQTDRYNSNRNMAVNMLSQGPDQWQQALAAFGQNQKGPGQIDWQAAMGGAPVDTQGIMRGAGVNAGNDSLMQLMRQDPNRQISAAQGIGDLATKNSQFDMGALFKSLGAVDAQNMGDQVAGQRAAVSGLGQRAGSGSAMAESNLRARMSNDINSRNAQMAQSQYNTNNQFRLGALTQQGQFQNQAFQNSMNAANSLNQNNLAAAGMGMQGAQFNSGQQQQNNQFNTSGQFNAAQGNAANQLNFQQMLLAALGQGGQLAQGQRNYNLGLMGQIMGQGQPGMMPANGMGQAAGNGLGELGMLPMIMQMMNRKPGTGANV